MLAKRSNPSNKEKSVFLPNLIACCLVYAGKGLNGGVGGNAVWTSVGCSVIGTSDFCEGSRSCGEIIDCLLDFNSIGICSAGCALCEDAKGLLKLFDMRFFQTPRENERAMNHDLTSL